MSQFFAGVRDQLQRLVRTRRLRLLLALFVGASTLCAFIYSRGVVEEMPVAVLDLDNSRLSRTLRQAIDATPELRVVAEPPTSLEQAQAMLTSGELVAAVVLPQGLSATLKRGRRAQVLTGVDMSNVLLGKTASSALARTLSTVSGGVELTFLRKLGERAGIGRARVQPVAADETLALNPRASYSVYVAPALVFFLLHITVIILGASPFLPPERACSAGGLLGREFAVLAVAIAAGLALAYGLLPAVGLAPRSMLPLLAATLAAYSVCNLLLVGAFQALLPSRMLAFQVALLVGMLSLMLAGATYPVDAFPAPLRAVAEAVPFTPFARALRLLLTDRVEATALAAAFRAFAAQAAAYGAAIGVGLIARRAFVSASPSGGGPRLPPESASSSGSSAARGRA